MNTAPLQKNTSQTDKAKALSAEAQAKLNSAEWLKNYKQMMEQTGPEVSDVNMRDQIAVAMRDPVYGQATAAGLAAGQNMLNSWIAGANSKSRMNKEKLANERWIKLAQDADEDRALRRKELEESKKRVVGPVPYQMDAFKEKLVASNPEHKALYDLLSKPYNAKDDFDAAQHEAKQIDAAQKLNAIQQSMPSKITDIPARSELLESEGIMDYPRRLLNAIPGIRRATLDKGERARANLISAIRKEGINKFFTVTPEQLRLEAARNNREGFSGLAGQQNKIAEFVERISTLNPGSIVKQSAGGDVIVIATPDSGSITITPGNFDKISEQYDIGIK